MNTETLTLVDKRTQGPLLSEEVLKSFNISLTVSNSSTPYQTWLLDINDEDLQEKYHQALQKESQVIMISDHDDEKNILETMTNYNISHIIGESSYITQEIANNMLKYHLKKIWGPEKYLNEEAQIISKELLHSKDANLVVDEILEGIDFTPFFDGPKNYIKVIYNELLTNAFYHMQDHCSQDRSESIFVSHEESVKLKLGLDKQKVAISVVDHNRTLSKDKILSSLQRSFRDKKPNNRTPGAGLGLYLVFHHANQLIFNCSAQHGNEIIAIIDVNKRYRNYKKRTTSFHYFYEA